MKWLAYMFVYERDGLLHLGRAIPRAWFAGEETFGAARLSTPAGVVSIVYHPKLEVDQIEAEVELELRRQPGRLLVRFRHPQKKSIRSVSVDGRPHLAFDAESGDIELTPISGRIRVLASY